MSWFNMFKKLRDSGELSPEELALIEEKAREEIEQVFSDSSAHQVIEDEADTPDGPAFERSRHKHETLLQGTRRVRVTQFNDWRTLDNAAREAGITESELIRLIQDHTLAVMNYPQCAPLVHIRQIVYWLENNRTLPVDLDVFDGWKRQAEIARDLGVSARDLFDLADQKRIAVFKPGPKCVLYNEREVYEVLAAQ